MAPKYYFLTLSLGLVLLVSIAVTTAQFAFIPINNEIAGLQDFEIISFPSLDGLSTLCPEYAPLNGDEYSQGLLNVIRDICSESINEDCSCDVAEGCDCEEVTKAPIIVEEYCAVFTKENKTTKSAICQCKTIETKPCEKNKPCEACKCLERKPCASDLVMKKPCICKESAKKDYQLILPPEEIKVLRGLEYLKCEVPLQCISADVGILGDLDYCNCCDNCCCCSRIKQIQDNYRKLTVSPTRAYEEALFYYNNNIN